MGKKGEIEIAGLEKNAMYRAASGYLRSLEDLRRFEQEILNDEERAMLQNMTDDTPLLLVRSLRRRLSLPLRTIAPSVLLLVALKRGRLEEYRVRDV